MVVASVVLITRVVTKASAKSRKLLLHVDISRWKLSQWSVSMPRNAGKTRTTRRKRKPQAAQERNLHQEGPTDTCQEMRTHITEWIDTPSCSAATELPVLEILLAVLNQVHDQNLTGNRRMKCTNTSHNGVRQHFGNIPTTKLDLECRRICLSINHILREHDCSHTCNAMQEIRVSRKTQPFAKAVGHQTRAGMKETRTILAAMYASHAPFHKARDWHTGHHFHREQARLKDLFAGRNPLQTFLTRLGTPTILPMLVLLMLKHLAATIVVKLPNGLAGVDSHEEQARRKEAFPGETPRHKYFIRIGTSTTHGTSVSQKHMLIARKTGRNPRETGPGLDFRNEQARLKETSAGGQSPQIRPPTHFKTTAVRATTPRLQQKYGGLSCVHQALEQAPATEQAVRREAFTLCVPARNAPMQKRMPTSADASARLRHICTATKTVHNPPDRHTEIVSHKEQVRLRDAFAVGNPH